MSKPVLFGFKCLNSAAANVAQTSQNTVCGQFDKFSYHCIFSAAASGTFVVEARSGDKDTWGAVDFSVPLTFTSQTEVVINLFELPFNDIRLRWGGDAACAGTLTVTVAAKAVGA